MEKINAENVKDWIEQINASILDIEKDLEDICEDIKHIEFSIGGEKEDVLERLKEDKEKLNRENLSDSAREWYSSEVDYLTKILDILNNKKKYELKLSLLKKKRADIYKTIESLKSDLSTCERILGDIAKTTVLQSDECMNIIVDGFIKQEQDRLESLLACQQDLLLEKELFEQYNDLEQVRYDCYYDGAGLGQDRTFRRIEFLKILKENDMFKKMSKYIKKYEDNSMVELLDIIKKMDVDDIGAVDQLYDDYKDEFIILYDYMNIIGQISFNTRISEQFALKFFKDGDKDFDDKFYIPGFKYVKKSEVIDFINNFKLINDPKVIQIIKEQLKVDVKKLQEFLNRFDVNNLTSEDIAVLIMRFNTHNQHSGINFRDGKSIQTIFNIHYENLVYNSVYYSLDKVKEKLEQVGYEIQSCKDKVKHYENIDKKEIVSKEIYGLVIDDKVKPIDSKTKTFVSDINSLVTNYISVLKDIDCMEKTIKDFESNEELFTLYKELKNEKYNYDPNLDVSTIVFGHCEFISKCEKKYQDALLQEKNFEDTIKESKTRFEKAESDLKNHEDNRDNILFTNKKGKVVKNKFMRFFFKMGKKYKENSTFYEQQLGQLQTEFEQSKNRIESDSTIQNNREFLKKKIDDAKQELERAKQNYQEYFAQIGGTEGIEKDKKAKRFYELNGGNSYSGKSAQYQSCLDSIESRKQQLLQLKKSYIEKLNELRKNPNIPDELVLQIDKLLSISDVSELSIIIDEDGIKYYDDINKRYDDSEIIRSRLLSGEIEPTMDSTEAVEVLKQGRRK